MDPSSSSSASQITIGAVPLATGAGAAPGAPEHLLVALKPKERKEAEEYAAMTDVAREFLAPLFGGRCSEPNWSIIRVLGDKLLPESGLKRVWRVLLFEFMYLVWISTRYFNEPDKPSSCPTEGNSAYNLQQDDPRGNYRAVGTVTLLALLFFLVFLWKDVMLRRAYYFYFLAHDVVIDFSSTMDRPPAADWSGTAKHHARRYWKIGAVALSNLVMFYAGACERDTFGSHNQSGVVLAISIVVFAYDLITFDAHDLLPFPSLTKARTGMRRDLRSGWSSLTLVCEHEMVDYLATRAEAVKQLVKADRTNLEAAVNRRLADPTKIKKFLRRLEKGTVALLNKGDVRAHALAMRRTRRDAGVPPNEPGDFSAWWKTQYWPDTYLVEADSYLPVRIKAGLTADVGDTGEELSVFDEPSADGDECVPHAASMAAGAGP